MDLLQNEFLETQMIFTLKNVGDPLYWSELFIVRVKMEPMSGNSCFPVTENFLIIIIPENIDPELLHIP